MKTGAQLYTIKSYTQNVKDFACSMKKIAVLLISIFSILVFGTSLVYADDKGNTAVTTEVPAYHTITINAESSVKIIYNGEQVKDSFRVERLSQPVISIQPDDGYKIKAVFLNSKDITSEIHNGDYTFDPVYEDKSLNITVEKIEQSSEPSDISVSPSKPSESSGGSVLTGDDCSMLITLFIALLASGGIVLFTSKKRKIK